jgi:hypothetical protein
MQQDTIATCNTLFNTVLNAVPALTISVAFSITLKGSIEKHRRK